MHIDPKLHLLGVFGLQLWKGFALRIARGLVVGNEEENQE